MRRDRHISVFRSASSIIAATKEAGGILQATGSISKTTDLLGTVKITWDSIMGSQNAVLPVTRTNDARTVRLNVTVFSQGGVYPDGIESGNITNQVQEWVDNANLIYAQAGVAFRATIKAHNMPTNNGVTLTNGIPCGYWMEGEGDFKKTNMIMDVTTQNWQMPDELVTFKTYVTNSANGILSSDPNDIEVLVALPANGFSYMQTNGAVDTNEVQETCEVNVVKVEITPSGTYSNPTTHVLPERMYRELE